MTRSLSKHRRSIGPGLLLAVAAGLPVAVLTAKQAGAAQQICEIPYICDRDTNRGGGQTATGTHDPGGSASSPTSDPEPSTPTGDPTSSAPTGD